MTPSKSIEILESHRARIPSLKTQFLSDPEFTKWQRDTEIAIERIFGQKTRQIEDFSTIEYSLSFFSNNTPDSAFVQAKHRGLDRADAILRSMVDEIETYEIGGDEPATPAATSLIELICLKFHAVARQLRSRRENRSTLEVADEYDVQDLMHALLRLHFDDIRAEEWSPSYAGSGSRVDFLLKDEAIVFEIKKTRISLKDGKLGEQLIVDIARYSKHPNCKLLVCFIYDPEGLIGNPVGLERDLEEHGGDLDVRVIVGPKS